MTDNAPSIMMNRQIGFGGWTRHPLVKQIKSEEVHWEMGTMGDTSPEERYCFKLWIARSDA